MQTIDQLNLIKRLFCLVKKLKQMHIQQGFSKKQIQHVLINYILPNKQSKNQKHQQQNHCITFNTVFKQLMQKEQSNDQVRLKSITEMLVNCQNEITKLMNENLNYQNEFSIKSHILLQKEKQSSKYQSLACNRIKQISKFKKSSQIQYFPNEPSLSRLCSIRERCQTYKNNAESLQSQLTLIKSFQKSLNDSIKKTRLLKQMLQQQLASDHKFGSNSLERGMFQMF